MVPLPGFPGWRQGEPQRPCPAFGDGFTCGPTPAGSSPVVPPSEQSPTMNGIVRFLSRPVSPAPRVLWPLLMLIALAPRPAEAAPVPAPQESDAQADPANYELAARFAPYRIREMVHSTSVDPQWIEGSDRFLVRVGERRRQVLLHRRSGRRFAHAPLRQRPHRRRIDAHHPRPVGRAAPAHPQHPLHQRQHPSLRGGILPGRGSGG